MCSCRNTWFILYFGEFSLLCRLYGEENERYEFEINDKKPCFLLVCACNRPAHIAHREQKQQRIEQYLLTALSCVSSCFVK